MIFWQGILSEGITAPILHGIEVGGKRGSITCQWAANKPCRRRPEFEARIDVLEWRHPIVGNLPRFLRREVRYDCNVICHAVHCQAASNGCLSLRMHRGNIE
jgi:hypothetical protein